MSAFGLVPFKMYNTTFQRVCIMGKSFYLKRYEMGPFSILDCIVREILWKEASNS